MIEKLCLECKVPIKGRADKKFCDDHCRSSYYNRNKIEENNLTKNINKILKKNRLVLSSFNPDGKTKIKKNELIAAGLNLNYHTQTQHTHNGSSCIFCYEYGYVDLGGEDFILVKKAIV